MNTGTLKNYIYLTKNPLLHHDTPNQWQWIVFTGEKLFTVEQVYNRRNDRYWSAEAPGLSVVITHCQNPQSVIVWGRSSSMGKTLLIFIDEGVKVSKDVYRRDFLESVVLPWARERFSNWRWMFQQDSAPTNKAMSTQEWCKAIFMSSFWRMTALFTRA